MYLYHIIAILIFSKGKCKSYNECPDCMIQNYCGWCPINGTCEEGSSSGSSSNSQCDPYWHWSSCEGSVLEDNYEC